MKIAKRLLILFITLTLCAGYANAEEYVTLAQLREQAAAGWNETYEAMGRKVVADPEMGWFPEADTCPLVSVDPYTIDPKDERVDKWRELPHSIIYDDLPDRIVLEVRNYKKINLIPLGSWGGKWLSNHESFYDGEFPNREAEDCDIDFKTFLAMFESELLAFTGLTLNDIHIEEILCSILLQCKKKEKDIFLRGSS